MKDPSSIPVVILCGGKGTRLGDLAKSMPKPLVPIGGMPILWHIMKGYAHQGFKSFVLCLGYKGEMIEEFFTKGTLGGERAATQAPREADWEIAFADTGLETGTSGRVLKIKPHVAESERFFLTYGDGVSNVALGSLLEFHERIGKLGTVTAVRPETSFGIIQEEAGVATAFAEKPRLNVLINGGFFVFCRKALDYIGPETILEREPLERLAREGQLAVFRHEGYWRPMDTMRERRALEEEWASGKPPWKVW